MTTTAADLRPAAPMGDLPPKESAREHGAIRGVALAAIAISVTYLAWRAAFTIDLAVAWLSIPFFILEAHALVSLLLFTFSLWDVDAITPPAPVWETDARIAVLIPTYNESREILLPTIAAAVALSPPHTTWVLDDGNRRDIAALAAELGASYIARTERANAKAGNINNALKRIDADFIAVLDADHVPTPHFLSHLLGYFDDPRVAVVQTPQEFYNRESFEHASPELRQTDDQAIYHEQTLFYRAIQPGKNRWGAAFWCGTNAIARAAALRGIGGIATETVTEDIHTTVRLQRRGWKAVYHNEILARGLAAQTAIDYQNQRFRWGSGAMQLLRRENPFFVSGLRITQRLAYATTLLGWFDSWFALGYLLVPIMVLFSGAVPIRAEPQIFLPAFGAAFLSRQLALRALSRGHHRVILNIMFELTRMTPNMRATLTLIWRGSARFSVTPKGRQGKDRSPAGLPMLLAVLLAASLAAATWFAAVEAVPGLSYSVEWAAIGAVVWLAVNAFLIILTILRARAPRFAGERRDSVRFETSLPADLDGARGVATNVSLTGAQVQLSSPRRKPGPEPCLLSLWFGDVDIALRAHLASVSDGPDTGYVCRLHFLPGQDMPVARLALALFNAQTSYAWRPAPPEGDADQAPVRELAPVGQ